MYFVNNKGHVIGLLKKKTAWYVLARAIREKARNAVRNFVKSPSEPGNFFKYRDTLIRAHFGNGNFPHYSKSALFEVTVI